MFLKRCEIKNFRSIKDLTVNFDNNFQILVGLNESGKSNILRALSFLEPTVIPNADDIRDPRHDEEPINESYVRFVFGFTPDETKTIYESVSGRVAAKNLASPIIQIGASDLRLP